MIGVGFALVGSRRFPDIHWPLQVAFRRDNVKAYYSHFSHYFDRLTQARCENKPLLQDATALLEEITSTAVEVRLVAFILQVGVSRVSYFG